ncbi:MAG: hypothetical protein Q8O40_00760, partial [Chloroflexota bacterium]|nr:hypothetical protein [Chloroflexota bacterium]
VVSLTERQLTDLMRESVGAAVRGVDIASGVMRAVTQVLGKVLSETPVRSQDARQVALQSVRSAVVAVVERGGDVASGSRIAVSSTFSVLARTKAAPHDLFWAGGFGAVQGAHEAGADLALAARGAVSGARDAALLAGLDENAAADSATTGALEAVTQLASDQREAVRKALEADDSYGESTPPQV